MNCTLCDKKIPPQERPGRPRTKCEECSPPRPRRKYKPTPPVELPASEEHGPGNNERAVREQIGALGRLGTVPGAAALDAAIQLDRGGLTGAARAALLKEMRTAAAEASKGASAPGGVLGGLRDELARRRDRRAG